MGIDKDHTVCDSPGDKDLLTTLRAAEVLGSAIYDLAVKLGIANNDHTSLSVSQCLHLIDCIHLEMVKNKPFLSIDCKENIEKH